MRNQIVKKFFSLLTSLLLLITIVPSTTTIAQAKSIQPAQIISSEVPSDVVAYADSILPEHLHAASLSPAEYGLNNCDFSKLTLGTPFNMYKLNDTEIVNTQNYYFPVLFNGKIVAILAVAKADDGNLSSTFSKGFAANIDNIVATNSGKKFRLVDINDEIRAVDNSNALLVANDIKMGNVTKEITKDTIDKVNKLSGDNVNEKKYAESSINITSASSTKINTISPMGVIGPTDSAYLSVPYVSQNGYNWCWAATCASIIDYKKQISLQASNVVSYIFNGKTPNEGGTTAQDIQAYNHWGLSPYYDSWNATWSNATSELKSGGPIHSLWYPIGSNNGHSMTVRGYEYYADTDSKVYLLIDPNIGYTSVAGQTSSGDCFYILNGTRYYWTESLRYF